MCAVGCRAMRRAWCQKRKDEKDAERHCTREKLSKEWEKRENHSKIKVFHRHQLFTKKGNELRLERWAEGDEKGSLCLMMQPDILFLLAISDEPTKLNKTSRSKHLVRTCGDHRLTLSSTVVFRWIMSMLIVCAEQYIILPFARRSVLRGLWLGS